MARKLFLVLWCLLLLAGATAGVAQEKRLAVVPAAGPLAGKTVYANSWALLVGVNHYQNLPQSLWLEYAVKDVADLRDVLVRSYGFPADHITVLTDEQATKQNIEDALADLADQARVGPDDRVLVFFSGHGQTVATADGGDQGFLIPYDANVDLTRITNAGPFLRTCVQMNTVWTYLDSSPAKHCLVIADACYSGLLASSRALETIKPEVLVQMASLRAMQVMTAGTKGQTSVEDPNLGHGAFTYKLLEHLRAEAATPGQVFTASDLYAEVCRGVLDLTNGAQYPKLGSHGGNEGDFLFITTPPQSTGDTPAAPPVTSTRTLPPCGKVDLTRILAKWKSKPVYDKQVQDLNTRLNAIMQRQASSNMLTSDEQAEYATLLGLPTPTDANRDRISQLEMKSRSDAQEFTKLSGQQNLSAADQARLAFLKQEHDAGKSALDNTSSAYESQVTALNQRLSTKLTAEVKYAINTVAQQKGLAAVFDQAIQKIPPSADVTAGIIFAATDATPTMDADVLRSLVGQAVDVTDEVIAVGNAASE